MTRPSDPTLNEVVPPRSKRVSASRGRPACWLPAVLILIAFARPVSANEITPSSDYPGALVLQPVSAVSTSYSGSSSPNHLVDGSGLDTTSTLERRRHATDTSTMWLSGSLDGGLGGPTGSPPTVSSQAVVFDLGEVQQGILGAYVWNYNATALDSNGVQHLEVFVSGDSDPLTATFTSFGVFLLDKAGGSSSLPAIGQFLRFGAPNVRLVKFAIVDNWKGSPNSSVGLSEVRFLVRGSAPTIDPIAVFGTSAWDTTGSGRVANLINGSGLSGVGPVESRTHDNPFDAATMWHAGPRDAGLGGPTGLPPAVNGQALVFDLGELTTLFGTWIWNHNQSGVTSRGVNEFEVFVSGGFNPLTADFRSIGILNLAQAGGGVAEPAQFVGLLGARVRLVKFVIHSAHSGLANDYVGLSEVRFVGMPDGQVFRPISAVATSRFSFLTDANHTIDASGLSGTGEIQSYVHDNNLAALTMWQVGPEDGGLGGPVGSPPTVNSQAIVYDLGSSVFLRGAYIWNLNQAVEAGRGVKQFEVLVSQDTDPLTATFSSLGDYGLAKPSGFPGEPSHFISLRADHVRLVKFRIKTAWSGLASDYVGLSEVRFLRTRASNVIVPQRVLSTSQGAGGVGQVANLIDEWGLSGIGPVESWTHDNNLGAADMWHSGPVDGGLGGPTGNPPSPGGQAVVFDLGTSYHVGGTYVWNHNQFLNNTRSVHSFDILTSSDPNPLTATFSSLGTFQLQMGSGLPGEPAQFVPFDAPAARLIKFAINSNWGGHTAYVGLSKVRFVEASQANVGVPDGAGLVSGVALANAASNPSRALAFRITLPDAVPRKLDVYDVSGRRIYSRDLAPLGIGTHLLRVADVPLAPGLYLSRVRGEGVETTLRSVVVR